MIKKIKYFLRKCFDCCPSECRDNVTEGAPGWRISQLTQETLVPVPQCGKLIHLNDSALHCELVDFVIEKMNNERVSHLKT